jgi:hypothetical protein
MILVQHELPQINIMRGLSFIRYSKYSKKYEKNYEK